MRGSVGFTAELIVLFFHGCNWNDGNYFTKVNIFRYCNLLLWISKIGNY